MRPKSLRPRHEAAGSAGAPRSATAGASASTGECSGVTAVASAGGTAATVGSASVGWAATASSRLPSRDRTAAGSASRRRNFRPSWIDEAFIVGDGRGLLVAAFLSREGAAGAFFATEVAGVRWSGPPGRSASGSLSVVSPVAAAPAGRDFTSTGAGSGGGGKAGRAAGDCVPSISGMAVIDKDRESALGGTGSEATFVGLPAASAPGAAGIAEVGSEMGPT